MNGRHGLIRSTQVEKNLQIEFFFVKPTEMKFDFDRLS